MIYSILRFALITYISNSSCIIIFFLSKISLVKLLIIFCIFSLTDQKLIQKQTDYYLFYKFTMISFECFKQMQYRMISHGFTWTLLNIIRKYRIYIDYDYSLTSHWKPSKIDICNWQSTIWHLLFYIDWNFIIIRCSKCIIFECNRFERTMNVQNIAFSDKCTQYGKHILRTIKYYFTFWNSSHFWWAINNNFLMNKI